MNTLLPGIYFRRKLMVLYINSAVMTHATSLNPFVSHDIRIMIRMKVSSPAFEGCSIASNKPSYELMSTIFLECVDRQSGIRSTYF